MILYSLIFILQKYIKIFDNFWMNFAKMLKLIMSMGNFAKQKAILENKWNFFSTWIHLSL